MGVFEELATLHELVSERGPTTSGGGPGGSGRPGSSVPPGAQVLIDMDEHYRALAGVDQVAATVVRILLDEVPGIGGVPAGTPDRLRLAGQWIEDLGALSDERQAVELLDDARRHRARLRRLARRGEVRVRTGSACVRISCSGAYEIVLVGTDESEDLVCSRCRDRVPRERWERWGAQSEWVTVERAMVLLGVATKHAVWSRAKREGWRRKGEGREVRYWRADVTGRVGQMSA